MQRRFGEIPHEVEARLEGESVEKLESLMDSAIAVNSLEEFVVGESYSVEEVITDYNELHGTNFTVENILNS